MCCVCILVFNFNYVNNTIVATYVIVLYLFSPSSHYDINASICHSIVTFSFIISM